MKVERKKAIPPSCALCVFGVLETQKTPKAEPTIQCRRTPETHASSRSLDWFCGEGIFSVVKLGAQPNNQLPPFVNYVTALMVHEQVEAQLNATGILVPDKTIVTSQGRKPN